MKPTYRHKAALRHLMTDMTEDEARVIVEFANAALPELRNPLLFQRNQQRRDRATDEAVSDGVAEAIRGCFGL